jgi:uncharacterized Zn finger protein (UPF0148 family)
MKCPFCGRQIPKETAAKKSSKKVIKKPSRVAKKTPAKKGRAIKVTS